MKIPCIVRGSIPLKNTISSWKPLQVLCTQISFQGPVQWDAGGIPRNGRSTPQGSKGARAPCVLKVRARAALSRPPLPNGGAPDFTGCFCSLEVVHACSIRSQHAGHRAS